MATFIWLSSKIQKENRRVFWCKSQLWIPAHLLNCVDIAEYSSATFAQTQSSSETPNHVAHYTQGCYMGYSDRTFPNEQYKVQLGIIAKAIRAQNSRCYLPQSQSQRATPFPSSIIMHRFPQYSSCQLFIPAVANAIEIYQQTPSLPAQNYAPYHAIKLPRNYLILQMPAGKALMITPTWT